MRSYLDTIYSEPPHHHVSLRSGIRRRLREGLRLG